MASPGISAASEESTLIGSHLAPPGQANDALAGCPFGVEVARRLAGRPRRYTLRFLFLPEHIGSVAYLSRNEHLLEQFRYGLFLEMLGIGQPLALQHSKQADSAIDKALLLALRANGRPFVTGEFMRVICNDEQVINGPGVGIPTPSLSRARPTTPDETTVYPRFFDGLPYPEYHTSDDELSIIDEAALGETADGVVAATEFLEKDGIPFSCCRGQGRLH